MVQLNRAQLAALNRLIQKVEIEQLVLSELPDTAVLVRMTNMNDESTTIALDKWGAGRLVQMERDS